MSLLFEVLTRDSILLLVYRLGASRAGVRADNDADVVISKLIT